MAEWKDTPKFFYPKSLGNSSVWMAESGKSWQEEFCRKKEDKVGFFRPAWVMAGHQKWKHLHICGMQDQMWERIQEWGKSAGSPGPEVSSG